jgi:DNA-binding phage protein
MKQQIKFKNLTEDQTIQMIDLDDVPNLSKPLTKKEFIKKYLQEIIDDNDGEVSVSEAFETIADDGDLLFITVTEGVAQVVIS